MDRYNSVWIRPNDDQYDNADLITLLYQMADLKNIVFDEVPQIKKDSIFFIEAKNIQKELFKYEGCFEWLNGTVKLWYLGEHVTRSNYRTVISDKEAETVEYTYLDYSEMTNEAPVSEYDEM